jgi:hypothetical protein
MRGWHNKAASEPGVKFAGRCISIDTVSETWFVKVTQVEPDLIDTPDACKYASRASRNWLNQGQVLFVTDKLLSDHLVVHLLTAHIYRKSDLDLFHCASCYCNNLLMIPHRSKCRHPHSICYEELALCSGVLLFLLIQSNTSLHTPPHWHKSSTRNLTANAIGHARCDGGREQYRVVAFMY